MQELIGVGAIVKECDDLLHCCESWEEQHLHSTIILRVPPHLSHLLGGSIKTFIISFSSHFPIKQSKNPFEPDNRLKHHQRVNSISFLEALLTCICFRSRNQERRGELEEALQESVGSRAVPPVLLCATSGHHPPPYSLLQLSREVALSSH